jgi:hypothetical protein
MEQQGFAPALRKFQKLLQDASLALDVPIRFALIGGLAVAAWGVVRATQDIDLLADSNPSPLKNTDFQGRLERFLERRGYRAEWRVGEIDDPIPLLLRLEMPRPGARVRADILWAHKQWHREALARTIRLTLLRTEVVILHPEDLILLKLGVGGPQDLLDVEGIISNPPSELDLARLKKKATQLRLSAALAQCLR